MNELKRLQTWPRLNTLSILFQLKNAWKSLCHMSGAKEQLHLSPPPAGEQNDEILRTAAKHWGKCFHSEFFRLFELSMLAQMECDSAVDNNYNPFVTLTCGIQVSILVDKL